MWLLPAGRQTAEWLANRMMYYRAAWLLLIFNKCHIVGFDVELDVLIHRTCVPAVCFYED